MQNEATLSYDFPHEVTPDVTTDGEQCFVARCLDLENCMSHGSTVEEALRSLAGARSLYLETLESLGLNRPVRETWTTIVWQHSSPSTKAAQSAHFWRPLVSLQTSCLGDTGGSFAARYQVVSITDSES